MPLGAPFHESVPMVRVCPGCKRELATTSKHWKSRLTTRLVPVPDPAYSDFDREQGWGWVEESMVVTVPSSRCRECMNGEIRLRRRTRNALAQLPPAQRRELQAAQLGPCDVCNGRSRHRTVISTPDLATVCRGCRRCLVHALNQLDPHAFAVGEWVFMRKHLIEEDSIIKKRRAVSDRPYIPYHKSNPAWKDSPVPHEECIALERCWYKVAKFFVAHPPTGWDPVT